MNWPSRTQHHLSSYLGWRNHRQQITGQICAVLDPTCSENQEKCQDVFSNTWTYIYWENTNIKDFFLSISLKCFNSNGVILFLLLIHNISSMLLFWILWICNCIWWQAVFISLLHLKSSMHVRILCIYFPFSSVKIIHIFLIIKMLTLKIGQQWFKKKSQNWYHHLCQVRVIQSKLGIIKWYEFFQAFISIFKTIFHPKGWCNITHHSKEALTK